MPGIHILTGRLQGLLYYTKTLVFWSKISTNIGTAMRSICPVGTCIGVLKSSDEACSSVRFAYKRFGLSACPCWSIYIYLCVCVCVCIYTCNCMYIYIYVYIYVSMCSSLIVWTRFLCWYSITIAVGRGPTIAGQHNQWRKSHNMLTQVPLQLCIWLTWDIQWYPFQKLNSSLFFPTCDQESANKCWNYAT
jgi:hypothetical protein